jgi:hypothetical protein
VRRLAGQGIAADRHSLWGGRILGRLGGARKVAGPRDEKNYAKNSKQAVWELHRDYPLQISGHPAQLTDRSARQAES